MFEVLIYLFERYVQSIDDENSKEKKIVSQRVIARELTSAGFGPYEIIKALSWLEELGNYKSKIEQFNKPHHDSFRVLTADENYKLGRLCQSFLLYLEQLHILTAHTREIIIDRAMAIDSSQINLEQLKWIVMLILFHQSEKEEDLDWLDNLMLAECHLDILH